MYWYLWDWENWGDDYSQYVGGRKMKNLVFKQCAKHLELIKRFFRPFPSSVVVDIPKKTLVLSRNSRSSAFLVSHELVG